MKLYFPFIELYFSISVKHLKNKHIFFIFKFLIACSIQLRKLYILLFTDYIMLYRTGGLGV